VLGEPRYAFNFN
nr:Chain A, degradation peptide VAL-LEU-GLY-GLU-PRO-ARG-TYR-ALA-PHE-ASN-PHE-ASN [Escherichia coli]